MLLIFSLRAYFQYVIALSLSRREPYSKLFYHIYILGLPALSSFIQYIIFLPYHSSRFSAGYFCLQDDIYGAKIHALATANFAHSFLCFRRDFRRLRHAPSSLLLCRGQYFDYRIYRFTLIYARHIIVISPTL